jgi:type IV secretion system protein VirD4
MKLLSGDGVILGSWNRQLLRHDGEEHVLVVAPTSTGKSVGISLPTGLVWRHSYIALDLKGENWDVTSGLRASFGDVYRFAPTALGSCRYNPLTAVRRGEPEVRDAQILADMLVDPEGALRERSHWQLSSTLKRRRRWPAWASFSPIRAARSWPCSRTCCGGRSRTARRILW